MKKKILSINLIVLIICSLSLNAQSNYKIVNKISLPGEGFWDYNPDAILYDSFSRRVFTGNGRSASFSVIDAVNNKEIGTIPLDGKPEAISFS